MIFSESLITELASRRCVIFLGAGASAACTNADGLRPPAWDNFLHTANQRFINDLTERSVIEGLINSAQYLDAAEIIFATANAPDTQAFYKEVFLKPNYQHSRLHEIVKELDSNVVITTNYDVIYDNLCENDAGYAIKIYDNDDILDEIRSPSRLIIKAHGTVKTPKNIILTRSKYFETKKTHQIFYNLLDSLFLTNTVLFIGCGLSDPDIQLVLENSNISVPSTHPHYAIVPGGRHPALVQSIKRSYNIQLVEYNNANGNHAELLEGLEDLLVQVNAYRATLPS